MEHKCEQSADIGVEITWCGSRWLAGWDDALGIAGFGFCPYCGAKLEKPDVKIEVSSFMLRDWANRLDHARDELERGQLRGGSINTIEAIAIHIKDALLND